MTDADPLEPMREVARDVLREIVPEILAGARARPNGNGHHAPSAADPAVPHVPPPPVAAVLRPSTWTGPAVPGEVIGDGGARLETVTLDTDEDLAQFVCALLARFDSPREKREIRAGRVRFTLGHKAPGARPTAPHAAAPRPATLRVTKGAVTERAVREAADRGVRLVLAHGAVLTPLARDQARALGVEIEKEGRC